ncbi:PEPxxWA-CTERM sorting domain-containing protein [Sphingomonas sp. RS2018]
MKTFAIAAALSMTVAAMPATAAELVTNGGFETGNFNGWTQFGNFGGTGVTGTISGTVPHAGQSQAAFGPVTTTGGIFQTLNTVVGQTYQISIWLANIGGGNGSTLPNQASISFGGEELAALYDFEAFPYTNILFDLTAKSAQSELRFTFRNDPGYFLLDDVSVRDTAVAGVPEPSSWAMLTIGFGALGGALRRRRKVSVSFG